jgi:hypothetical protein
VGGCNRTASDTPNSATEQKRAERLDVSHARAVQDADRVFTLCDIRGRLILRDDLRPKQDASEIVVMISHSEAVAKVIEDAATAR